MTAGAVELGGGVVCESPKDHRSHIFFSEIEKELGFFSSKYERIILMGDFNREMNEKNAIQDFAYSYDFYNIVKSPTCFKSDSPRCIDLILTNRKFNFKNTTTAETGLSDFHAMVITILKG